MSSLIPGEWTPADEGVHEALVSNLMKRTRQFTPDTIKNGGSWYGEAQQDAAHFGTVTGTSTRAGGAAIGRLSGGTEYNLNRLMAIQVPLLSTKQQKAVEVAGRLSAEGAGPEDVRKVREKAGLGGTPLWFQSARMGHDALKIARGEQGDDPMSVFGGRSTSSNKTLDFGEGVASGGKHPLPPIDTHAYDAAHDRYDIPYGVAMKHTSRVGVYDAIQGAYAEAHQKSIEKGLIPADTTLADYQAMHWVHHIANKRVANPKSASSAKAGETKVRNILSRQPELSPEKFGLPPLASGEGLSRSVVSRTDHFTAGAGEGR